MFPRLTNELKIFIILIVVLLFTASGNIDSIDAVQHILLANTIALKGRIYFTSTEIVSGMQLIHQNEKFLPVINAGFALEQTMGTFIDYFIRTILHVKHADFPHSPNYVLILFSNFLNAFIMSLIGVVIYKITILYSQNKPISWKLIPLFIICSTLYIQGHQNFPIPSFIFYCLLTFYFLSKYYRSGKSADLILSSLFFALMGLVYNMTFIYFIPPLFIFHVISLNKQSWLSRMKSFLMVIIPALILQFLWNYIRFNNIFSSGYTISNSLESGNTFTFSIPIILKRLYGMTFGPNKGIFLHNPILLIIYGLAIRKLIKFKIKAKFEIFFISLTIVYVVLYSSYIHWHGDETYGPRYLTPILPFALIILLLNLRTIKSRFIKHMIALFLTLGFLVQIPGILIPSFGLLYLSPTYCKIEKYRYYHWRCSPIKVGWSHLLKRRVNETFITTGKTNRVDHISLSYPNPPTAFRTVYPDPFFDRFSEYKTTDYKVDKKMMNDIYSFTLDIWWIKALLYKNIINR